MFIRSRVFELDADARACKVWRVVALLSVGVVERGLDKGIR